MTPVLLALTLYVVLVLVVGLVATRGAGRSPEDYFLISLTVVAFPHMSRAAPSGADRAGRPSASVGLRLGQGGR